MEGKGPVRPKKYAIVGAGPAGLALACVLADSGHAVSVYEKKPRIGGSWKGSFDGGYFTENSPRVLVSSAEGFLEYLGLTSKDFHGVYGNAIQFNLRVLGFLVGYLSFCDWGALAKALIGGVRADITFGDWIVINEITPKGARGLEILCIAMNDVPSKTNAREFFNMVTIPELTGARQFRDPNKWCALAIKRITSRPNCEIVVNAEVSGVFGSPELARGVIVDGRYEFADRVMLCTQATGLVSVLRGTPFERNWPMVTGEWAEATSYYSFGFQLHFSERVNESRSWCWACRGPWTVIVLPVGDWLEEKSMDPGVLEVWSCCVVDTRSPSPFVGGLCVDEITDAGTVVRECMRQIGKVNPKTVTLSPGLYHNGRRWVSGESGFTSGVHRRVPIKGFAPNLFAIGCFSESDRPVTAHFGSAISAVMRYLDMYDPKVKRFKESGNMLVYFLITLVLLRIAFA